MSAEQVHADALSMMASAAVPMVTVKPPDKTQEALRGRTLVTAWVASVFFHVTLFLVMLLTPWITGGGQGDGVLLVADTELLGDGADVRAPGPTTLSDTPTHRAEGLETPLDPQAVPRTAVDVIQPQPMFGQSGQGTGSGSGPGAGSGSAPGEGGVIGISAGGGDLDQYGLTAGGSGGGPRFFGTGGGTGSGGGKGARRVVYVVDRSGSMLDTFDAVREELMRSVRALGRRQRFHVLFFNVGEPIENPPKKLVPAIDSQKEAAFGFVLGVDAKGGTDPAPAMARAFECDPDLIFFLTDGDFDPVLLDKLREWNKRKLVRISTIAYLSRAGEALLRKIAQEHGGEFKFVADVP